MSNLVLCNFFLLLLQPIEPNWSLSSHVAQLGHVTSYVTWPVDYLCIILAFFIVFILFDYYIFMFPFSPTVAYVIIWSRGTLSHVIQVHIEEYLINWAWGDSSSVFSWI